LTENSTSVSGIPLVDLSVPQTITWDSVPSDQKTIKIELVVAPQGSTAALQSIDIASNVPTSDHKYVMQPPSGVKTNTTYQIFFYAAYNETTTGIVAESHSFNASKAATASSTTKGGPSQTGVVTTITPTQSHNAASTLKTFGGAGILAGLSMLFL